MYLYTTHNHLLIIFCYIIADGIEDRNESDDDEVDMTLLGMVKNNCNYLVVENLDKASNNFCFLTLNTYVLHFFEWLRNVWL